MKTTLTLAGLSALFLVIPGFDMTTGFFAGTALMAGGDAALRKFEDPYAPKKRRR